MKSQSRGHDFIGSSRVRRNFCRNQPRSLGACQRSSSELAKKILVKSKSLPGVRRKFAGRSLEAPACKEAVGEAPCREGSNKHRGKGASCPKLMRDLCSTRARLGNEPFYALFSFLFFLSYTLSVCLITYNSLL